MDLYIAFARPKNLGYAAKMVGPNRGGSGVILPNHHLYKGLSTWELMLIYLT